MKEQIERHFAGHLAAIETVASQLAGTIERCALLLADSLAAGNKVLVMGNGGSAADAQHFAAELVGRFLRERRALPAIALTTDSSILTAVGNDYGFDAVFSRQVEALAAPGDVVVGISTSGRSANVQRALEAARERGCRTVAFLGRDGGTIAPLVEMPLVVPVQHTPFIQEAHATIVHILCDLVESRLFPPASAGQN
jgi:D-sedoheptulose 7-phosphate isomerase